MPLRFITDPQELADSSRQPRDDTEIWFQGGAPSGLLPDNATPPSTPGPRRPTPPSARPNVEQTSPPVQEPGNHTPD